MPPENLTASEINEAVVLIVAPFGRDAQGATMLLEKAGIGSRTFPAVEALCEEMNEDSGVLLIAEESITAKSLKLLQEKLEHQPVWSDLPVIVLTRTSLAGNLSSRSATGRLAEALGNVIFLERPLHALTLISAVRSGLKARKRQYQSRDYISERESVAEELRVSERKLSESNRELERFATIVSHDLQAPLRKVMIFSDYLATALKDSLSGENKDYFERIQRSVDRMQLLITDLLVLSRVTRKTEPFQTVDLEKIVSDTLEDLSVEIKESGGQVEVGSMCRVHADGKQMHQMLVNLISNALKYHKPDCPPRVKISSLIEDDTCRLIIEDQGIGIKPEHQDRIFEIFQRLHGVNEYSGTGIGLSIVRRIVDRHEGTIHIESEPGEGTRFIVSLPVQQKSQSNEVLQAV